MKSKYRNRVRAIKEKPEEKQMLIELKTLLKKLDRKELSYVYLFAKAMHDKKSK